MFFLKIEQPVGDVCLTQTLVIYKNLAGICEPYMSPCHAFTSSYICGWYMEHSCLFFPVFYVMSVSLSNIFLGMETYIKTPTTFIGWICNYQWRREITYTLLSKNEWRNCTTANSKRSKNRLVGSLY